jgi:NAD(P)-dependent dehydrogenase (short-subunit alcohol dehydrogenase family)
MDLGLKNKVVLLTEGDSAIGAAIAAAFAEEGASLALIGADGSALERTKAALPDREADVLTLQGDLASESGIRKAVTDTIARFGKIDVVVHNAGEEVYGLNSDVTTASLADLLKMKVLAPWELARAVAPHMRKRGKGRFIVVISDAGKIPGRSMIASAVAGAAQHAFVKSLSDELGPHGILVTGVSMGHIRDPNGPTPPIVRDPYISRSLAQHESNWAADVPLGRWGEPADVANAVVFLSSDSAGFICGSNLDVDGGDQRSVF